MENTLKEQLILQMGIPITMEHIPQHIKSVKKHLHLISTTSSLEKMLEIKEKEIIAEV
ncbi:MAG: hypothetical protein GX790_06425 [Syntrophomonadaceae bacterium]|nr:hypothetical protein [Syntrophomonadaceae bacterium]